ncbi:MAG: energy transducer TonB [Ignavibacteriae bacterium]|nr:energy transducer TonB [Ignavibacteriota bacterium]
MYKKLLLIILLTIINTFAENSNYYGIQQNDEYLAFAEQMPEPVGGLESVYKLIKYPELAQKAGVQGKVYVLAFIDENGTVDDVKVVKGIGAGCDEATVEAVKKSKFAPGKSGGKNVKVKMSLQIQFKIS